MVSNHVSTSYHTQPEFILTQLLLSQILKVLMAFQTPSDARFRVLKVAAQRDKRCSQMWLKLFTFVKLTKAYG